MASSFRPGEMDQRVSIKREQRTPDGMGGSPVTFSTVATVWAHVRPLRGNELEAFDRVNGEAGYLFVLRYTDDVEESDRLEWEGVDYNIRFIKSQGARHLYLEIEAERGVGQ